jgi:peroxiredoxin
MYDNALLIKRARALLVSALVTLGATAAHHVYGGIRYASPWRTHAAVAALLVAPVFIGLYLSIRRAPIAPRGRAAGWALALLSLLYPITLIGGFEGSYNHVVKNWLYFGGMSRRRLLELFPPPTYELPNDVVFEVTGVLQVVPAGLGLVALLAFLRALRGREAPSGSRRMSAGARIEPRQLSTISGATITVPDRARLVHLQFRRFAGCPVCHLHLRSFVRHERAISAAGVLEVVVFHSTAPELQRHAGDLPFCVIADPDRRLYLEFGVESGARALLDPRAWLPILWAVAHAVAALVRGRAHVPSINPLGGRWGLPADFLIDGDGRVVASKYGEHADDHWSVEQLLALAGTASGSLTDAPAHGTRPEVSA